MVVADVVEENIELLDGNRLAEVENLRISGNTSESVCNPVITKMYRHGNMPHGEAM